MTDKLLAKYGSYMLLKIFIEDESLRLHYSDAVTKHNMRLNENKFIDAGFDICSPSLYTFRCFEKRPQFKIDFEIKTAAYMVQESGRVTPTGFYMYPRSSLSKTYLRLANSVGIIDAGYRGNLIGVFDNIYDNNAKHADLDNDTNIIVASAFDRLCQICSPNLGPVYVELVTKQEELSQATERGEGGFGSTGLSL